MKTWCLVGMAQFVQEGSGDPHASTCHNSSSAPDCKTNYTNIPRGDISLPGYAIADVSDCCSKIYKENAPNATFDTNDSKAVVDSLMDWVAMLSTGSGNCMITTS